jgi:hypothetical protein
MNFFFDTMSMRKIAYNSSTDRVSKDFYHYVNEKKSAITQARTVPKESAA